MDENNEKQSSNKLGELVGKPFKAFFSIIAKYAVLAVIIIIIVFSIPTLFTGLASHLFSSLDPFSAQKKAVAEANKVDDSFSRVKGSTVNFIPLDGIDKYTNFSSVSNENIQIIIPKIKNSGKLFISDANSLKNLKNAFISSINKKELKKQTKDFQLFYNGNPIYEYSGKVAVKYLEVKQSDVEKIEGELDLVFDDDGRYDFLEWKVVSEQEKVSYKYDKNDKNIVNVKGRAILRSNKGIKDRLFKKEAEVNIKFKNVDDEWEYVTKSLKIEVIDNE